MTKKHTGIRLFGAALLGAAIGCGIAYFKKQKEDAFSEDDLDEFEDDFEEDLDAKDTTSQREYVTLPTDAADAAQEATIAEALNEAKEEAAQDFAEAKENATESLSGTKEELAQDFTAMKESVNDVAKSVSDAVSETIERMQSDSKKPE